MVPAGVLMGVGLYVVAHFIPPHWPSWTAEFVSKIYLDRQTPILIGMVLMQFSTALWVPFWSVIYAQMRRIEGKSPPVLSISFLSACIGSNLVALFIPGFFFMAAAFRPERNPEITQIFNDIGWFYFTIPAGGLGYVWALSIALCILLDKHPRPLFPRWVGFMSIWLAVLMAPTALIPFLKSGPFAWNGILAFWLVLAASGVWTVILIIYLLKAIDRDDYEAVYV